MTRTTTDLRLYSRKAQLVGAINLDEWQRNGAAFGAALGKCCSLGYADETDFSCVFGAINIAHFLTLQLKRKNESIICSGQ